MSIRSFLQTFVGRSQAAALRRAMRGEECCYFQQRMESLRKIAHTMPRTYQTDGQGGEAVAHLHYFTSSADWYIVELDASANDDAIDGVAQHTQAFGLANLGWIPELGYINIPQLLANGAELDLHWVPVTLDAIRAKSSRGAA